MVQIAGNMIEILTFSYITLLSIIMYYLFKNNIVKKRFLEVAIFGIILSTMIINVILKNYLK